MASEGTIHIATETVNPFHAAPLAVYTDKSAKDLPDVLREAHYPDAWWKAFEGGWISRQAAAAQSLRQAARRLRRRDPDRRSRRSPPVTTGCKAQEVVQAAYLSQRDRRWVDLPLPADAPFVVPTYS